MSRYLPIWASLLLFLPGAGADDGKKLGIEEAYVSDSEGGARVGELHSFAEGEKVYLDFRIAGFAQAGDPPRVKIEYDVAPVDDLGRSLAPGLKGVVDEEITAQDKNWRPHLRYELEIPQVPRPTAHRFEVRLKDLVANVEASAEIPFRVASKYPAAPASLSVYDFKFFRSEYDEAALQEGQTFHPEDKIFLRFYVTGFRFGKSNSYNLEYGLQLKDAAGKILLNAHKAAAESRESYYPKDFVPCAVAILLERSVRPGNYAITLSVRDVVGNQRADSVHPFVIE